MTDAQSALAQVREALNEGYSGPAWYGACDPHTIRAILAHEREQEAEIKRLRAALKTCVWALRQPLDGWKGECERKALDEARDALKEQR